MPLPFFIITLVLLLLFSSHSKKTKPTSTKLPSFPSHPFFLFYLSSFFLFVSFSPFYRLMFLPCILHFTFFFYLIQTLSSHTSSTQSCIPVTHIPPPLSLSLPLSPSRSHSRRMKSQQKLVATSILTLPPRPGPKLGRKMEDRRGDSEQYRRWKKRTKERRERGG